MTGVAARANLYLPRSEGMVSKSTMTGSTMATKTIPLQKHSAKSLKRKNFKFVGDVSIEGNVQIENDLVVAGDLFIGGDCQVKDLYCLGHVTIQGAVRFGSIRLLGVLECHADVNGENLAVVEEGSAVFADGAENASIQAALDHCYHRQSESQFVREKYAYPGGGGHMVRVKGNMSVDLVEIEGALEVGDDFTFDQATIRGSSAIHGSVVGNSLEMTGTSYIDKRLVVHRKLRASCDINCEWSCTVGDMEVQGNLEVRHAIVANGNLLCSGHVKSDNRIQVRGMLVALKSIQSASSIYAGKGLQAGEDYGIHAGMSVPLQLHPEHGYIAAPAKPARIRSGLHVTNKKFKKLSDRQLVQWPADDFSDRVL